MNGASPSSMTWLYDRFSMTISHTRLEPMTVDDAAALADEPTVGLPPKEGREKDGTAPPPSRLTSTTATTTARVTASSRPPSSRRRGADIRVNRPP